MLPDDIYTLNLAPSLPTLPFEVFKQLLDRSAITSEEGILLRHLVIEVGAMHLLLNCLAVLTHQSSSSQISSHHQQSNEVCFLFYSFYLNQLTRDRAFFSFQLVLV